MFEILSALDVNKASGIDGISLIVAQTLLLSSRQVSELKSSQTVITSGRSEKNIPVDLHMEHFNRRLKIMVRNLRSNISSFTGQHAAKALAVTDVIHLQFLKATNISDTKQCI